VGVTRHGGIPPWDDDNDLGYVHLEGTQDIVEGLGEAFRKENLTLQRNRTGAYWQLGENAPGEVISPHHIDLFPYFLESGVYVNADPRFRSASGGAMCNTTYTPEELFPLDELPFYDGTIPVPAKPGTVLDRALGKDWRRRAVVRTPGKPLDYVSFDIRDFSPA
jgi:hypothetical protein